MANPCTWRYSGDDWGTWDTTCGRAFCMINGTPLHNDYHYCPGCGGPLVEVMPPAEPFEELTTSDRGAADG